MTEWSNWSGRVRCHPDKVHRPESTEEIESIVRDASRENRTIRIAGAGHSFSDLVATDDWMVSLDRFTGPVRIDRENRQATVRAGTPLSDLGEFLWQHDLSMENLGDVDRQSVAGALSTGTHGTGIDLGVLATQIAQIRLMTPEQGWIECSPDENSHIFRAAQISLGSLGILAEITLDLEPAYHLQEVVRRAPLEECLRNLDDLRDNNRHFEFFWFPGTQTVRIKTLNRTDQTANTTNSWLRSFTENTLFEGFCRFGSRFPSTAPYLNRFSAWASGSHESTGPAHEVFASERSVRFNEMEYGVPTSEGPEAFRELRSWMEERHSEVQFPVEYRYVQEDDIPLSPAHGGDRAFIAVHKYHRKPHEEFLRGAESIFQDHNGRPHWGKIHFRSAEELRTLYPEWDAFQTVREDLDPAGMFLNDYLRDVLVDT